MNTRAILLGMLMAVAPGAGWGQAVKDKPDVTLDPGKAYVMYVSTGVSGLELIRDPSEADIAAYKARRSTALEKAHRSYLRKLADWEARDKLHREDRGMPDPGLRPVEPTDSSFSFPPIEFDLIEALGPFNRFSKANDQSVYLQAVPPGNYRIYGPIMVGVGNVVAAGVCMCMGTVQFRAEPGVITHLGKMHGNFVEALQAAKVTGTPKPQSPLDLPEGTTSLTIEPATNVTAVDPRIAEFPVKPAAYRPSGKMPNWYGIEVDRLTAMPGVFSYDRDRMIDLTVASEVGNP